MAMNKAVLEDDQLDGISGGTILPYKILPGDTLKTIADKYKISEDDLLFWNKDIIKDPNKLDVGIKLEVKF